MKFSLIDSQNEFQSIKEEWNQLLSESIASHVPFLRHEYLLSWWEFKGGDEWPDAELAIITARSESGRLLGIAPFFQIDKTGRSHLLFLGSIEISDFLDFIVAPDDLEGFLVGMIEFLENSDDLSFGEIDLFNLREDSPSIISLENLCQSIDLPLSIEKLQPSPFITLPGDWEMYLASIKKKQRHEIRRKIRRFENQEKESGWYFADDPDTIDDEIIDFIDLMALEPAKEEFLTSEMRSQLISISRASFDAGWLQLAFLEYDGKKIGAYMNFDYANCIWVYNSGFDPQYRELSPGWVLLGYLIQWANTNGRREFDFMRGDEEYKYRFGGINRYVFHLNIQQINGN